MSAIDTMNGTELVNVYNKRASANGLPTVKKFKDLATGRSRLASLLNKVKASEPKPKAPAKEKAPTKPKAEKPKKQLALRDAYGTRVGTNRNKLFILLEKTVGKPVSIKEALKVVYGSENPANMGAIGGVIKGVIECAPKGKATVVKEGEGIEGTLTLKKN